MERDDSAAVGDDQRWWFCLRHSAAEHGPGCPNRVRLGPYPSREAAENALQTVQERNEEWESDDER